MVVEGTLRRQLTACCAGGRQHAVLVVDGMLHRRVAACFIGR